LTGTRLQQAIVLTDPVSQATESADRLYFGAEFCCWALPALEELQRAVDLARQLERSFSLLLPVFSEPFLPRLTKVLRHLLPLFQHGDEVVVSDLGGIQQVREIDSSVELVIGRALSGQKRGPRILDLDLAAGELNYFRQGSWYNNEAVDWLREQGIERVELDNLLQGVAPLPAPLRGSLHLPWAMVTSSRNCPFRDQGETGVCIPKCGQRFTLRSTESGALLHQGGNTQFLENTMLPDDLGACRIDRIVRHMTLPR